jgi:hypothetical protein
MLRWSVLTEPLALSVAGLCLVLAPGVAAVPEVVLVERPPPALAVYRNSHATAAGWLLGYYGLSKPNEDPRVVIATAAIFMEFCECEKPGKPTAWHLADGLWRLLVVRHCRATIREKARYSHEANERATFDDYAAAVRANTPVVLTFCYDPDAKASLAEAARRVSECTTTVGIGFAKTDRGFFLICRDGLEGDEGEPVKADRVTAADAGLPESAEWSQPGTSLCRWDGTYANLVLTFVPRPEPTDP